MKYYLIYTIVVGVILISGCESQRKITMVIDTQPSGADIYRRVPGGAWVRCEGITPVKLSLELKYDDWAMTYRVPTIKNADGHFIDQGQAHGAGGAELPYGLNLHELSSQSDSLMIDFRNTEFRKAGYIPLHPSGEVSLWRLFRYPHDEYNFVFPFTTETEETYAKEAVVQPLLQTPSTGRMREGFLLNLRVVGIPSGEVASTISGVTSSKRDTA